MRSKMCIAVGVITCSKTTNCESDDFAVLLSLSLTGAVVFIGNWQYCL